ncbi:alpha/beta fold hydrolase [Halomonas sp. HK25]|uniref:alpha/beta fold hydrolase n=1 Tax=Halomonas sp. HK25 TaxID=3394321 RepID=UPI0039FCAE05
MIAADSWGDSRGPLVLLSHGVGQTRHSWRNTGKLLGSCGYFVVAYDARGHGDSSWPSNGDYSRMAMIHDMRSIIKKLGKNNPALVGASMGGAASMVAVGEGFLEASALVLVDIAPHIESNGLSRINAFMEKNVDGFTSLEEVAAAIQKYSPRKNNDRNLDGLAKNVRFGEDGRYYWHWDPRLSARERDSTARRVAAAKNLSLPTLLVRGAKSDVVSQAGVDQFLSICPHAEYVNLQGARHMVAGDKNDIFGAAIIDFLSRKLCL